MNNFGSRPPVVILSGGSEVVSVSLADEFRSAGQVISVVSLGKPSVLAGSVPSFRRFTLDWPTDSPEEAVEQLIAALSNIRSRDGPELQIFPTEDGGLRLLLEYRKRIEQFARFGRSRALPLMGGLDKAELFEYLVQTDCEHIIAPTLTLNSPADAENAWSRFDGDCVVKPSLKPWSMEMREMPGKALMTSTFSDFADFEKKLKACWHYSRQWVVQPRLYTPADGERVVYLARDDNGKTACVIASEPRKQPRYGGTSCEVVTKPMDEELAFKSQRIADALDLVGLCELAFLKDAAGQWRMLEVNPRPWLQIGLARAAGVPLARQASLALAGHSVDRSLEAFIGVRWASIELLLISAMSGNYGSRWRECAYAISVLRQANSLAIYSTESPGVRWRWWLRLLSRLFTKWGHES